MLKPQQTGLTGRCPSQPGAAHIRPNRKKSIFRSAAILSMALAAAKVTAEITTDSYTCRLDGETRAITLTFLNDADTLPCEIRAVKNSKTVETLWRAENDLAFCRRQFSQFRVKQENIGWSCETTSPPAPATIYTTEPHNDMSDSEAPVTGAAIAAYPEQSAGPAQVVIVENKVDQSLFQRSPPAPGGKSGNLSADDIRDMDDWLIYLSAQTMTSIRELIGDTETFKVYQQRETRNAANIYQRLQSRIEFLNKLLANSPEKLGVSQTEF